MDSNELYHHGILGMKWGIRRYQNKDGSLTAAGKKRVGQKTDDGDDTKHDPVKTKPKSIKDMSDEELQQAINRLNMEKRYKELATAEAQKKTSNGKAFVKRVLEKSGENIATQLSTYVMGAGVNKVAESLFNTKDVVNPKKGQKDK